MKTKLHLNDLPTDLVINTDIAIDTEAMGLNTYRDKLCLVQICCGDDIVHLVKFDINKPYKAPNLSKLLINKKIQKIFHFARFDLAILQYYLNIKIENIYCTKIASKLARTYSPYHGLKDLVQEFVGKSISKGQQSSNWGKEELSLEQMKYAANDVLYLHQIRDSLKKMLVVSERSYLVKKCTDFLQTRVELDMQGFPELDIFHH